MTKSCFSSRAVFFVQLHHLAATENGDENDAGFCAERSEPKLAQLFVTPKARAKNTKPGGCEEKGGRKHGDRRRDFQRFVLVRGSGGRLASTSCGGTCNR